MVFQNTNAKAQAIKARFGFDIRGKQDGARIVQLAHFQCSVCPTEWNYRLSSGRNPPEHIVKRAVEAGWSYKGQYSRWFCPDCGAKKKVVPAEPPIETVDTVEPPKPKTPQLNPTGRQWHEVLQALEVCFDREGKRYEAGYDDARVAEEIKVPLDIVKFIRQDEYGDLAPDPELASLHKQITFLQDKLNELILTVERQHDEISLLRNKVHAADPAGLEEIRTRLDKADLPGLIAAVRDMRAQLGKSDVRQIERLTNELRAAVAGFDFKAAGELRNEVAALRAQLDGHSLEQIAADIDTLQRATATTRIPLYDADDIRRLAEEMSKRPTRGVHYLPKRKVAVR